jgi:hypothetical protein
VAENQKHRKITFFKSYFQDFFDQQSKKVKAKIVWTFDLIEELQRVPETYLKHIESTDGLYEIRVQLTIYFAFSVFSTKENWSFWQTDFKRKHKRLPRKKLKRHST